VHIGFTRDRYRYRWMDIDKRGVATFVYSGRAVDELRSASKYQERVRAYRVNPRDSSIDGYRYTGVNPRVDPRQR